MPTILVIDDNPAVATALEVLFSLRDLHTIAAESPAAGLAILGREPVDVVIQDMNFRADTTSGEDGAQLFRTIHARFPDLPVILLTAWTQLASAVELVKAGAADYLAKPWDDTKLLTAVADPARAGPAARPRKPPAHRARAALRPVRGGVCRPGDRARDRAGLSGRPRRCAGADHRPQRRRQGEDRRDHPRQLRCRAGRS
jgi:DNA-binding NtrC family response regulator